MTGPEESPKESVEQINSTAIAVEAAPDEKTDRREQLKRKTKPRTQPNYHVIIWNDEEHTYDYVIELLMTLFGHPFERAYQITHEVDHAGKGIAWTCHQELAELKRDQILGYGADWRMQNSTCSIRSTIEPAPD
jgi:ATP-dependent Clp protease adaptor protein ClpS